MQSSLEKEIEYYLARHRRGLYVEPLFYWKLYYKFRITPLFRINF